MPAQWLNNSSDIAARSRGVVQEQWHRLSQPAQARRLRRLLLVILSIWIILALVRLVWALLPQPELAPLPANIVNPVTSAGTAQQVASVDISKMVAWHLFGEVGAVDEVVAEPEIAPAGGDRDGIEEGARETRLDLTLRGVVASTGDGLGHAIIEYRSQQDVYAVEDQLPVSGKVLLAKVMPRQVVLDNGGNYELLTLFEETPFDTQLQQQNPAPVAAPVPPRGGRSGQTTPDAASSADPDTAALAQGYRNQLYNNPQSLAELVSISAVREDGELMGYRIAPGQDQAQFEQLGFEPGDLVTGVNGITLNDPANTMKLYQAMRTATEAAFDLERGGESISINVSLGATPADQ